jgi:predicted ABC-type ATPase
MWAGPNGSGKSTLNGIVPPNLIGFYVNADDIEKQVKATGVLDLSTFNIRTSSEAFHEFIDEHSLLVKFKMEALARRISLRGDLIDFTAIKMDSYFASATADFIRHRLLEQGENFTFETVMSSEDKVQFLELAHRMGYRTYLYYVSLESVEINIQRVATRVAQGGHPVEEDKIRKRYERSLGLLHSAVEASDRAYIFDNTNSPATLLAEITNGTEVAFHAELPDWFIRSYVAKVMAPGDY